MKIGSIIKSKLKYIFLFSVFFISLNILNAVTYISKVPRPLISDFAEDTPYNIIVSKGLPFIELDIVTEDNAQYKGIFLISTSLFYSFVINKNTDRFRKNVNYEYYGQKYIKCIAKKDNLIISDFYLYLAPSVEQNNYIWNEFISYDFYGVLGTDFLLQKSFYISLTDKEIRWKSKKKINEVDIEKNNCKFESDGESYYLPGFYCKDEFFLSDNPLFTNYDKTKSWYIIDTSNYPMTTNSDDFYRTTQKYNYKTVDYQTESKDINFVKLQSINFLSENFNELKITNHKNFIYDGSPNALRTLGCQVLSRYNIYIEVEESNCKITDICLSEANEDKYKSYRNKADNEIFYLKYKYDFIFNTDGLISFVNNLKYIKCLGHKVISVNGIDINNYNFDYDDKKLKLIILDQNNKQYKKILKGKQI